MPQEDWIAVLNSVVKNLLNDSSSQFLSLGMTIASGLAIILIVRFGLSTALSGHGFDMGSFFKDIILLIGACLCIMKGYATPMDIFGGKTFPDLIIEGPMDLASQINQSSAQKLNDVFGSFLEKTPSPINPLDIGGYFLYYYVQTEVQLTRGLMFYIYGFGLVAQAVLVMIGPVFIPFLLFPPMSFMFWGWFRSLLQYSFYPVICACFANVLTAFFLNLPILTVTGQITISQALAMTPYFFIIILGMLSVPLVVSGLFSGSSGGGIIGKFIG